MAKPATASQLNYVRILFRRSKFHYNTLDDQALTVAVKANTGFDLDNLDHDEVQRIVNFLKPLADQKRTFKQWGRTFG